MALPEQGKNFILPLQARQLVGALVRDGADIAGDIDDGAAHRSAHHGHIRAPVGGEGDTDL